MNNIFSDKKMQDEFLAKFDELKEAAADRFNKTGGLREEEKKALDDWNVDNARKVVNEIAEGNDVSIPRVHELIILQYCRPAYLVQNNSFNTDNTPSTSIEVDNVVNYAKNVIERAIPSVGRINLLNHRMPWVGTGWVVAKNVLVTNQHVASAFAASEGDAFVFIKSSNGRTAQARLDTVQEYNSEREKIYRLNKVLWIAPPSMQYDVAFLSIKEASEEEESQPIPIALMDKATFAEITVKHWVTAIGYPARSPYDDIVDQQRIFNGIYDFKRMQPGQLTEIRPGLDIVEHDATTLTGNSGSVLLDLISGKAIALHFGGDLVGNRTNTAVTAPIVAELLDRYVTNPPVKPKPVPVVQELASPAKNSLALSSGTATWRIPLEVSVTVGTPELIPASAPSAAKASATAEESWFFSSQPELSIAELTAMFSASSLTKTAFDWRAALSLAAASELAYRDKSVVEETAEDSWGLTDCKFIDVNDTQCFIASSADSVLISFRGTQEIRDWLVDFNISSIKKAYGTVHRGFYDAFYDVKQLLEEELKKQSSKRITLTGHSLGGALATIAAAEWNGLYPTRVVYTFGQPAVGKGATYLKLFSTSYSDKFFRFVNDDDIVTRVPPNYQHIGKLFHFDAHSRLEARTEAMSGEANDVQNMMSEVEFDTLRAQLLNQRAARRDSTVFTESLKRGPVLEGFFPSISDHHLSEYIKKIKAKIS